MFVGMIGPLLGVWTAAAAAVAEPLRVAAAISLQEALTDIAADFKASAGIEVELVFGSSGQLLAQVRNGAPLDVFISAAREQVDALLREELAQPGTKHVIAGNTLVLIVPADAAAPPAGFGELAEEKIRRVAIGDPATVPAGQYARQVLDRLQLTDRLKDRLVYGTNVRQVLSYVEQKEVSAGLVYATDARAAGGKVRVVATAEAAWHSPIEYPAVALRNSRQAEAARKFLEFLGGEQARARLQARGFGAPASQPATAPAAPSPATMPMPEAAPASRPAARPDDASGTAYKKISGVPRLCQPCLPASKKARLTQPWHTGRFFKHSAADANSVSSVSVSFADSATHAFSKAQP